MTAPSIPAPTISMIPTAPPPVSSPIGDPSGTAPKKAQNYSMISRAMLDPSTLNQQNVGSAGAGKTMLGR